MKTTFVLAVLLAVGCATPRTITPASHVEASRQRATECVKLCTDLGMKMTAMVVILGNAGCVCEPVAPTAARSSTNAAVAASAIAVVHQQHAARAAQQQQRN